MDLKRLETARLFHRFGFGPRPGEFEAALKNGVEKTRSELLAKSKNEIAVTPPVLIDLGKRPEPKSPEITAFSQKFARTNYFSIQVVARSNGGFRKSIARKDGLVLAWTLGYIDWKSKLRATDVQPEFNL
jgi:hypothetical protein